MLCKELLFVCVLVLSLVAPSSNWRTEFGDGREYILQTQSIALDYSLGVNPGSRGDYFNVTNPFGINLKIKPSLTEDLADLEKHKKLPRKTEESDQYGGGFGGLYTTLNSSKNAPIYLFIHSWVYSAVVTPIYICSKFLADLFGYLGEGAMIILLGLILCSILIKLRGKLLTHLTSLSTHPANFESSFKSVNLFFEAVSLTCLALILKLFIGDIDSGTLLEYQAFYLANIIFFSAAIALIWGLAKTWLNLIFIAVICVSPIVPHIKWAHSEVFCLASIILGLGLTQVAKWRIVSPIFLGLGAAQNIPIILTLPFHLFLILDSSEYSGLTIFKRAKSIPKRLVISYAIATLFPILIAWQNYDNFAAWNLIASLNQASISNLTLNRIKSVLLSPQIGALLYFPATWFAIVLGILSGRFRVVAVASLTSLAMVLLSSTTANINSAQLSATRYSIWTLSPLYLLPAVTLFRRKMYMRWQLGIITLSLGMIVIGVTWLKTYNFVVGDVINLFSTNRARPEIAALYRWTRFNDDIEPLVENIQGAELREAYTFSRIYIWNLGDNSSMWVISKRSYKKLGKLNVGFKKDLSIESSSELAELFQVSYGESGDVWLAPRRPAKVMKKQKEGSKKEDASPPPSQDIEWSRNPYWGSYRILWVPGQVVRVDDREAVLVRGFEDTM